MKALLDTHVLMWAAATPERLGSSRAALLATEQRLCSAVTAWELAIKQGLGRLDLGMEVGAWILRAARELRIDLLDITVAHAAAVEHLPPVHRDPFDRLLVAQARVEGAVLWTADRALLEYGDAVRHVGS